MILYHLTFQKVNKLIRNIPKNYLTKNNFEENKTKRICFSTQIKYCLRAFSMNLQDKILCVYCVDLKENEIYKPKIYEVPDVELTHEIWYTKKDLKAEYLYSIKITKPIIDDKNKLIYKYDNNKEARLYDWEYEITDENNFTFLNK